MKPKRISAIIALTLVLALLMMGARSFAASSPARVSLDLKNAELAEVFRVLATVGGANIVVSPAVIGKVTVKLNNVELEEALGIICSVSELEYVYMDGTIMVTPKGTLSKVMQASVVEKLEVLNVTASDAATKLSFAVPGVAVQPDDKSGMLLVRGTQADLLLARAFLAKVDVPVPASKAVVAEEEVIDIIQLVNAEAKGVYEAVGKLLKANLAVDTRLNAILAGGKVSDVKAARSVVEKLDVSKKPEVAAVVPVEIRVTQLANASAADVKPVIGLIVPSDRVQTDAKSNSLIVKATPEEHAKVAELVKNIEAATPRAQAVVTVQEKLEVINLQNAKASDVAKALSVVIPSNKITTDERTNKVIIMADAAKVAEALGIVKEMDVKIAEPVVVVTPAPATRMGYYTPAFAKAADIAAVVKLAVPNAKLQVIDSNNSVVAYGTEADHAIIEEAVRKLDKETEAAIKQHAAPVVAAPVETLEIVQLKQALAADVKLAIGLIVPSEKIQVDAKSNSLIVKATPEEHARVAELVKNIEAATPKAQVVVTVQEKLEVISLQNAKAADVAKALAVIIPSNKITTDERTNKVIILTDAAKLAEAMGIVKEMDVKLAEPVVVVTPAPVIRMGYYVPSFAKAADVAAIVKLAVPNIKLQVIESNNSVVVYGTEAEHTIADEALRRLDKEAEAALTALKQQGAPVAAAPVESLEIVQLKNAPAAAVAEALSAVLDPSKIRVDDRTNKLIMKVSENQVDHVMTIINGLDVPVAGAPVPVMEKAETGFYKLYYVKPTEIAASVKAVAGTAKVEASDVTSSITAYGTPSELKIIESLINKLDVKPAVAEIPVMQAVTETLEVVQLTNASVADIKAALGVLMPESKIATNDRTNKLIMVVTPELKAQALAVIAALDVPVVKEVVQAQPVKLGFYQLKYASAKDMEAPVKLVAQGSRVQVAERTNSLIVYGTEAELALVEQVIAKLDIQVAAPVDPTAEDQIVTYRLANASPTDVQSALTIIVPASSMMPDDRSKTLIVKARPELQKMVSDVLMTLDVKGADITKAEADAMVTRVYKLNYATPTDVKAALAEVTGAKMSIDPRTSSIVVTAKISEHEQIVGLIDELDIELAQVFFEASLYELSGDAGKRLGIDWTINKLVFGYNTLSQLATVSLDFDNKIAALASEGKAKLISKQHTFTVDGKAGRMLIGDRIPVIVQRVEQGQVVNSVEYINAGIELSIIPKVSYDGSITAEVKPIISSIVGWTPQNYPQIRTRELETIVTVKNGESAIIGGLFSQEEIETVTKVPILGDIPLIKELFTKRGTDTKDQEIIIVITAWTIRPGQTTTLKDGIVEIKGPVL